MTTSIPDLTTTFAGVVYRFRAPTLFDPARSRRMLTRQRVRRPSLIEFRVTALAGIAALAEAVGDADEGARQAAVLERWYELLEPTDEDEIDEPDLEARAAELAVREAERRGEQLALQGQALMIEATLERHWQPYAELLADRTFWDEVARIEIVRLLLDEIDGAVVRRDAEGMMAPEAYAQLSAAAKVPLASFAFRLLAPDETQRKN